MLKLYRRHTKKCGKIDANDINTCLCPLWVYGIPEGQTHPVRQSLNTTDLRQANRTLDRKTDDPKAGFATQTIAAAIKAYLSDCRARNLKAPTLVSYTNTLEALTESLTDQGISKLGQITVDHLATYRETRRITAKSQRKELEHIRSFFWFCVNRNWLEKNPAKTLKPPKDVDTPTLPFEAHEVTALLAACDKIDNFNRNGLDRARLRAKALTLTFLYTGLRISDVVKLERSRVRPDGKFLARQMKTGKPVYIKLNRACLDALRALPVESKRYFFWSGQSALDTAIKSARRTIALLGRLTGIHAHPHRFRDTFAVELLMNGYPIRTVQLLLGHESVKTTEKHYAPWVVGMQDQLDEAVGSLSFD